MLTVGCIGCRKLYILGVAGYDTPIWDVLVTEGERDEAAKHIYSPKLIKISQLGKQCQWDLLRLDFAPGLMGLGIS